ncbi:colorectal cancer associated 2, partial [Salminus brasiliensis]|uniref:colorectal cancer associated 2 n=1 Tax=Salminus brasiliensis TaxID=930266 RepID=UPI003B833C94
SLPAQLSRRLSQGAAVSKELKKAKLWADSLCFDDKPKVYQGVRVKTTVKELLQKRRALQAAESRKSQAVPSPDSCLATLPAAHGDAFPASSAPDTYFQPRQFVDNGHISMEDAFDHQFLMNVMPSEGLNASSTVCSPAAWMDGYIPACTEYYNNTLAPSSPTHSFNLSSSVDYCSYSPPESHSSSSSCYSSPSRLDLRSSFAPESCHYQQHCDLQHYYSHWPALHDAGTASEYTAYSSSDCFYPSFGEDLYCRRESSAELCYL